jgi:hypothetical protein
MCDDNIKDKSATFHHFTKEEIAPERVNYVKSYD